MCVCVCVFLDLNHVFLFLQGDDHDEAGVAEDMYQFMHAFFDAHSELTDRKLILAGESYAGHYLPATAARIGKSLNLVGMAAGNGLTDPLIQYQVRGGRIVDVCLLVVFWLVVCLLLMCVLLLFSFVAVRCFLLFVVGHVVVRCCLLLYAVFFLFCCCCC